MDKNEQMKINKIFLKFNQYLNFSSSIEGKVSFIS